MRLVVKMSAV